MGLVIDCHREHRLTILSYYAAHHWWSSEKGLMHDVGTTKLKLSVTSSLLAYGAFLSAHVLTKLYPVKSGLKIYAIL